jgi:hypothetical protein
MRLCIYIRKYIYVNVFIGLSNGSNHEHSPKRHENGKNIEILTEKQGDVDVSSDVDKTFIQYPDDGDISSDIDKTFIQYPDKVDKKDTGEGGTGSGESGNMPLTMTGIFFYIYSLY